MVRKLLLISFLFILQTTFSQEDNEVVLFSEAIATHLPKYEIKAKAAYRVRNYKEAQILFDSLVNNHLNGSIMDDFKFNRLNSEQISLAKFKKPVYLITYASWCVKTIGEIPALNELAKKYSNKIDFVVLFWDDQKTTKKAAKDYNKYITVLYIDEMENKDAFVIRQLKHSLGLPTTFLLDDSKKVLDVRRGVSHSLEKSLEESIDANYNSIHDGIANHLLKAGSNTASQEPVALN